MTPSSPPARGRRTAALCLLAVGALSGCAAAPTTAPDAAAPVTAAVPAAAPAAACPELFGGPALTPADGVLAGVNLDWSTDSVAEYAERVGHTPAVAVSFAALPLTATAEGHLDAAVAQLADASAALMLTVEPVDGLASVTPRVAGDLAADLARWNAAGVPVYLRFAHEMNGSWYPWGQQPAEYVAAFRRVAAAVHTTAPGSATVWAPNYGGGYPFAGGPSSFAPGTPDHAVLDTDDDGALTPADDPYAPYYPGDDAVDWAGLSLYHWGAAHPWGDNAAPEPGKLAAMLTGTYAGTVGDERAVPDFAEVYGTGHGLPLAITETAALWSPDRPGSALQVKQPWIAQAYDPSLPQRFPSLKMVNWFEWDKTEPEVDGRVDWTATRDPEVRAAYRAARPDWLRTPDAC